MYISVFIKRIVVDIAKGVEDVNAVKNDVVPVALFPSAVSFSIPLDVHGNIDWDGSPNGNRQCDFSLTFCPCPPSSVEE